MGQGQPSPAQAKVLSFIKSYHLEYGYAPRFVDIGEAIGVSAQTVGEHIRGLELKGLIRRRRGEARTVVPTERREEWAK